MKLYDRLIARIDEGRSGMNEGLPFGLPSLVDYLPNIQKKTYYLLGGESGSGKTSLTDFMFLYSPFNHLAKLGELKKLKVLYYSFEIDTESKICKGAAQYIWYKYKVLVDLPYILSQGKNRCSDEVYEMVKSTYQYFEQMNDVLEIHDLSNNPTGVSKRIQEIALENGKFNEYGVYQQYNPDFYFLVIIDHASLVKGEKEANTTKLKIDLLSEKLMRARNKYGITPIVVSQFNRSLSTAERELATKAKPNYDKIKPQLSDFKSSGNLVEDCNIALSIFSPNRYSIPEYLGYDINRLADRVRFVDVLKNRNGTPDLSKAVAYLGEAGIFSDLPLPSQMESIYSQLSSIKKVIQ